MTPTAICGTCDPDPPPANVAPSITLTAPTNGQTFVAGSIVGVTANASDYDGTVTQVDLLVDGYKRGTDTTAPYSFSWTSTVGTHQIIVVAYDNAGAEASAAASITVNANNTPTASVTAPTSGQSFVTGTVVTLSATAADTDGGIARVDFLIDGTKVGQDTSSPYSYAWTSTVGNHTVTAKSYDNLNAVGTSAGVAITVNKTPTAAISAPTSGQTFVAGSAVTLSASATDTDGTISRVDFLIDGTKVGQDTASPYAYAWTSTAGNHSVTAKAYDNLNGVGTSTGVAFTVNPNVAPSVSLTAPSAGQGYTTGSTVNMTATASDSDGSINRVEFLVDGAEVAQDTTAPYAGAWVAGYGSHTVTARAYDNLGAVKVSSGVSISVANPPTTVTRNYVYNSYQELCKTIEPETGATVMSYDAAGNLAWSASGLDLPSLTACQDTDPSISGRQVIRTYDQRNRIDTLSFPDNRGNTTYDYTPDGLVATLVAMDGTNTVTTNYTYNARRQLVNEQIQWPSTNWNWSLGYTYNRNGHLATQTYPGSLTVDYAPNGLGQPTKAGAYATGVTYHPNGGVASFTYGNGIVHTMTQNTRQLPERSLDAYGTTAVLDDSYDFDANANVAAISDGLPGNRGNRDMTYDGLNRLTSTTSAMFGGTISYTYDPLDNIQTVVGPSTNYRYCYEAGTNRLIFVRSGATTCSNGSATTALEYDVQGNLRTKNATTYTFDFGNRLRSTSGAAVSSYVYDGNGRRVRDKTTADKYSLYNQAGQLAFTSDYRKAEYANYIYLGGSLVATRTWPHGVSSFTVKYQHTDALGSPVAVTDANRSVVERPIYEPYGKSNNPDDNPGYTGHVEDAATGLTYMQQRYYDPAIGRFLSVDPVTADGATGANFNRYWYANNNPYRFTDPDGRQPRRGEMNLCDTPGLCGTTNGEDIQAANNSADDEQVQEQKNLPRYISPKSLDTLGEAVEMGEKEAGWMLLGEVGGRGLSKIFSWVGRLFGKAESVAFRSDTSHIFRNARGHLANDTPANRALLRGAVRPENLVRTEGPNGSISLYREVLPDGRQVWVKVRGGEITNAGVNATPLP